MKIQNEMKVEFISRSSNESFARSVVSAFISQLDPTVEELNDIKTAVSEAVTNAIVHGYAEAPGWIYIKARIFEDKKVTITIRDKGCGISDIRQAMEPLFTTVHTGERSGLGFTVMQSFMDQVRVTSKSGKGTTVSLSKRMKSRF